MKGLAGKSLPFKLLEGAALGKTIVVDSMVGVLRERAFKSHEHRKVYDIFRVAEGGR